MKNNHIYELRRPSEQSSIPGAIEGGPEESERLFNDWVAEVVHYSICFVENAISTGWGHELYNFLLRIL